MRRAKILILVVCELLTAKVTPGHDIITTPITFSREISRLIYSHCASCHHAGGAAFSLATYAEARPWAVAIKEEVLERKMPPWGAVKGFGEFQDDRSLTQEQIGLIADWVEGGAPEGDPKLLPDAPRFSAERAAPLGSGIPVDGALTLKTGILLAGIQPQRAPPSGSAVITATRPDGSVEPLLWIYNYQARSPHTYWYKSAVRLDAGSRIEVTPPGAVPVYLITQVARTGAKQR